MDGENEEAQNGDRQRINTILTIRPFVSEQNQHMIDFFVKFLEIREIAEKMRGQS